MSEILTLIDAARRAAFDRRFDEAARHASSALDRLPTCLVGLRVLAWAQLELDDDAALERFQQCAESDPEDALAHVGQAIWHQRRGQREAAAAEWVRAWELDPHNQAIRRGLVKLTGELPEAAFADAVSLVSEGRAEQAVEILRRVRAERTDVAVDLVLISALWGAGAQREAFDLAISVLARHPHNAKAALYVAAKEDRAGRTLRSREAIARAEQVDPGLSVFGHVVRQVGLQVALDQHRASRAQAVAVR
jgi:tetratricopeptide (TPR) repeat protein